jgi:uncharacterized protein (TIGR02284 family)
MANVQASAETDIDALNDLIETTIDSADGYEQAAASADDADLGETFRRFGTERRQIVADLRAQVVALGGVPEDDGTVLAGAHRAFLRLKSIFGSNRQSVIDEVEAGEDHIKAKYDDALHQSLTPETRRVVEIAYGSVREGHDTFSAMKHAYGN